MLFLTIKVPSYFAAWSLPIPLPSPVLVTNIGSAENPVYTKVYTPDCRVGTNGKDFFFCTPENS